MPLSTVRPQPDDLSAARRGDPEAFGRLIQACAARVVRLARSIVGDVDADDVAQESCLACWRHLGQVEDPAKFENWLMRITYRTAVRRARWRGIRARIFAAPGSAPARGVADPVAADPTSDLLVWQVLSGLPARQRAVLHLTVVEGMTDSEIAEALGISAGTVRAHRRRARARVDASWTGREG